MTRCAPSKWLLGWACEACGRRVDHPHICDVGGAPRAYCAECCPAHGRRLLDRDSKEVKNQDQS